MTYDLPRLMLLACAGLCGLAMSGLLLMRSQQRRGRQLARIGSVVGPYRSSWSEVSASLGVGRVEQASKLSGRLLTLLHYDRERRAYYRLPVAVVLVIAAILATGLSVGSLTLLHGWGWFDLPLTWFFLCRTYYKGCERRVQGRLYMQFPDALAMIVRAVRVGLPVVEAIRAVAREAVEPTAREFAVLVDQTAIGVPLEEALREMAARNQLPEYRFFATALSLQSQTGGGLTETLDNLAETIRKRVAARLRGHALAAEARMSAYILGGLPIVTTILLSIINPTYMAVLFTDPSGRKLLMTGVGLLGFGAFSMRTLIRRSLT